METSVVQLVNFLTVMKIAVKCIPSTGNTFVMKENRLFSLIVEENPEKMITFLSAAWQGRVF
jgi:hypothetical protein